MRKEELDRRSDELKARMLAERNQAAQKKPSSEDKRESASERLEMDALKKRIAQLVAENESLHRQTCVNRLPGTIAIPI